MSTRVPAARPGQSMRWGVAACLFVGAGAIGGCSDQQPSLVSELAEHPVVVGAADLGESVVVGASDLGESVVVGAAHLGRGCLNLLFLDGGGRNVESSRTSYRGPTCGWTYFSFGQ